MEGKPLSLLELNKTIKENIRTAMPDQLWVVAEIAQVRENYSGHCYLELIEKSDKSDKIIAQAKGMIWSNTYRILKPALDKNLRRE